MRNMRLNIILLLVIITAAACGTQATPVPNSATLTAQQAQEKLNLDLQQEHSEEIAVVPTNTLLPTSTPVPSTATPTDIPQTPTPTEQVAVPQQQNDQITRLVQAFGDPASGQTLFSSTFTTAQGDWACTTCHYVDREDRLIGPGMLNLHDRAGSRVEGLTAEQYVFNSIIHPNDFIVPGDPPYPEGVMPQNYREVFTDQQLYDLAAYLLSLGQ